MQAHITLGRLFGVQIGLHYTWLLIALLLLFSLAGHWQAMHATWGQGLVWALATGTALLFFAALVAHELAHAVVARARGLPVRSITLFALGGWRTLSARLPMPAPNFGWGWLVQS